MSIPALIIIDFSGINIISLLLDKSNGVDGRHDPSIVAFQPLTRKPCRRLALVLEYQIDVI
jgi:hypothetical protein